MYGKKGMKIKIYHEDGRELAGRFWDVVPRKGEFIKLYGDGDLNGSFEVIQVHWAGDETQYAVLTVRTSKPH